MSRFFGAETDKLVYDRAWEEGWELVAGKLHFLDRYRNRGAWFAPTCDPPWGSREPAPQNPPIIAFYSFKGGVGRTTALAAFAVQRARAGERIAVVDCDLDAPGVGTLLAADPQGTVAGWGVVDYLLEKPLLGKVDFTDYHHACRREEVAGRGEILVVPAGRVDEAYLKKLARLDLEVQTAGEEHPFFSLLNEVKALAPNWILLDVRAGLADTGGLFMDGLAHLHVLFGTFSEQNWQGLRLVLRRLGGERVERGLTQAGCFFVQALAPSNEELFRLANRAFAERTRDEFDENYYAEAGEANEEDSLWTILDAETSDAPSVPVPVRYSDKLAYYRDIGEVADFLAESRDYLELADRIAGRFGG